MKNRTYRIIFWAIIALMVFGGLTSMMDRSAVAASPDTLNAGITQNAPQLSSLVGVRINFQPASADVPDSYRVDAGDLKGSRGGGWTYGWAQNLTANTRDRDINSDQRLDTFVFTQSTGGTWEVDLPNGDYQVTVSMGDAAYDQDLYLTVEGTFWWQVYGQPANTFKIETHDVTVADGALTLSITGPINYVDIFPKTTTPSIYRDWGDAPDSYHTLLTSNGPYHTYRTGLYLGGAYDDETNGAPNSNADGDDTADVDDEDAIDFDLTKQFEIADVDAGFKRRWQVEVTVEGVNSANLYGWIDFDGNGTFDADEEAQTTVSQGDRAATLEWIVPNDVSAGDTYARFRLTTDNLVHNGGSSAPDQRAMGSATDGEVEDYKLTIIHMEPLAPGTCADTVFQTRAENVGSHFQFAELDLHTSPIQEVVITGPSPNVSDLVADPDDFNGIGMNDEDGFIYAWYFDFTHGSRLNEEGYLTRIDTHNGRIQFLGNVLSDGYYSVWHWSGVGTTNYTPGDPLRENLLAGDMDDNDHLYLSSTSSKDLFKVDIKNLTFSAVHLTQGGQVQLKSNDIAYNSIDGFLYGIREVASSNSSRSSLLKISTSGAITERLLDEKVPAGQGGAVIDQANLLYSLINSDGTATGPFQLYTVDVTDPTPNLAYLGPGQAQLRANDVGGCLIPRDYGDLPDTFKTIKASDGARSTLYDRDFDGNIDLYLGSTVDADRDGFVDVVDQSHNATDDDAPKDPTGHNTGNGDDEDGVTLITPLIPGQQACVKASMHNNSLADASFNGWIDFNSDGTFTSSEGLTGGSGGTGGNFNNSRVTIPNGDITDKTFCFQTPSTANFSSGKADMRFRISTETMDATDWKGLVVNGEVEDYETKLACIGNYVWDDSTGTQSSVQDNQDTPIANLPVRLVVAGLNGAIDTDASDSSAQGDDFIYTTTTDSNGRYTFCGVPPGTYQVQLPDPPAHAITAVPANVGGDEALDSDGSQLSDLSVEGPELTFTDPISISVNDNAPNDTDPPGYNDNQTYLAVDFGFKTVDWGDAPDSYATDNQDNSGEGIGASHVRKIGLYLGSKFDQETNGQPTTGADGDDNNGIDDEDGVDVTAQYEFSTADPGFTRRWTISVTVTSTATANLYGWVDFDRNGSFDADEMAMTTVNQNDATATLAWVVPDDITAGDTYARFRITTDNLTHNGGSSAPDDRARGEASNGEVEDYKLTIRDFGAGGPKDTCDDSYYQTRAAAPGANYHFSELNLDYDPIGETEKDAGPSPKIQDIVNGEYDVNALGYNVVDGYIYADMWKTTDPAPRRTWLIRINPNTGGYQILGDILADADYTFQGNTIHQGDPLIAQNVLNGGAVDRQNHIYLGSTNSSDMVIADFKTMTFRVLPITLNGAPEKIGAGDFSFNPEDGKLYYAHSNNTNLTNELATIDPATGVMTIKTMRDTFPAGQGGAVFDESGHLYSLANTGGNPGYKVYRIDVSQSQPILEYVGTGSSDARSNDAAGCKIGRDFGDLPSTYITKRYFNGPRHDLVDKNFDQVVDLYMGDNVDADTDGFVDRTDDSNGMATDDDQPVDPNTPNDQANGADEDGITNISPLIPGQQTCFHFKAHNETGKNATLYTWWDFNGDGDFGSGNTPDSNEFQQFSVGGNGDYDRDYCFTVPSSATLNGGKIGLRFRLTTDALTATSWKGGASDGEVEDYMIKLACVGNYVWDDSAGATENIQDASDSAISGLSVRLVYAGVNGNIETDASDGAAQGDDRIYTLTTNSSGIYNFCGLVSGTYRVEIPTPPSDTPQAVTADQGGNDALDSDGVPVGGAGSAVNGPDFSIPDPINLTATDNAGNDADPNGFPDNQTDLTFDFGFKKTDKVAIGNLVWNDVDNDGVFDRVVQTSANAPTAETGIDGAKLNLYQDSDGDGVCEPGSDTFITTTTTSGGGIYQFLNLTPSDANDPKTNYCVALDSNSVKPTYSASSTGGGGNPDASDDQDDGIPVSSYVVAKPFPATAKGQTTSDQGDPAGYYDSSAYMTVDFGVNTSPNAVTITSPDAIHLDFNWMLVGAILVLGALAWFGRRWRRSHTS